MLREDLEMKNDTKVVCPKCQSLNRPNAKYCAFCGTSLEASGINTGTSSEMDDFALCLECGHQNRSKAIYCAKCGKKITKTQIIEDFTVLAETDTTGNQGVIHDKTNGIDVFEPPFGTDENKVQENPFEICPGTYSSSEELKQIEFESEDVKGNVLDTVLESPFAAEKTIDKEVSLEKPVVMPFIAIEQEEEEEEEDSVFAQGLPEWDMLPPQIMVRRRTS